MADGRLRRTLNEHVRESHREAAMYPMPTTEAQQLVAERRVSYEAIALRRHFRRYLSRQVAPSTSVGTRAPLTIVGRHASCTEATHATKVA